MVICLELDADLHMAQLIPLPLTVSCFSTFLGLAHPGAIKLVCVTMGLGRNLASLPNPKVLDAISNGM